MFERIVNSTYHHSLRMDHHSLRADHHSLRTDHHSPEWFCNTDHHSPEWSAGRSGRRLCERTAVRWTILYVLRADYTTRQSGSATRTTTRQSGLLAVLANGGPFLEYGPPLAKVVCWPFWRTAVRWTILYVLRADHHSPEWFCNTDHHSPEWSCMPFWRTAPQPVY